ncbi:DNA polymerase III subunit delta' [Brachybacterium fresconis]|uniref:DNA polymerase-3 subunit delta n=1 Tax=Brachybacterium fresconis TaxID=173363 RepID=A0ABS4YJB7_9MICO|nr:DNA polymerase-3 subunit delta' [Brachybacterium fresconis]
MTTTDQGGPGAPGAPSNPTAQAAGGDGAWADVVGQEAVVAQFRRAASSPESLAQAWLITGPPGSGRSTAARAFAATLQCEVGSGCGRCHACRTVLAGTHPDVTVVATDKLSIAKDEVRALVMTAQRAPATGAHRVMIVEDADRMSAGTFNVLLKSIEEPPPATVWMLCAPSAEDLAPTIRSRCRQVTLSVPSSDVVAELLRRRDGVPEDLALRAARASQGHIGLALRYATQEGALAAREDSARTLLSLRGAGQAVLAAQELVDRATAEAKTHADTVATEEKERFLRSAGIDDGKIPPSLRSQVRQLEEDAKRRQTRLVRDVLDRYLLDVHSVLRDVMSRQLATGSELVNVEVAGEIEQVAANGSGSTTLQLLEAVQEARNRISGNVPPLLAIEALLARIALDQR